MDVCHHSLSVEEGNFFYSVYVGCCQSPLNTVVGNTGEEERLSCGYRFKVIPRDDKTLGAGNMGAGFQCRAQIFADLFLQEAIFSSASAHFVAASCPFEI